MSMVLKAGSSRERLGGIGCTLHAIFGPAIRGPSMHSNLNVLLPVLLLAGPTLSQSLVQIPAHRNTYTGFSRGFQFVAQTAFDIVRLELPPEAFAPGDTAGYLVIVNGVERLRRVGIAPGPGGAGSLATRLTILPGDDVSVLGNWSPTVTSNFTASNSYGNVAPYATTIQGVAHTLQRTGWQWDIADNGYAAGSLVAPAAGQIGRVLVYTAPSSGTVPPALTMTVEQAPGSGVLGSLDLPFFDGDTIRWNYDDFSGGNAGAFAATVMNVGNGAPPTAGTTPQIPGWIQLSTLSTPMGLADFFGPSVVGGPDVAVVVPTGLFSRGDVLRFQALILDPQSPGSLPVRRMTNTVQLTYTPPPPACSLLEGFEGIVPGPGSYPAGWSDGGGTHAWRANTGGTSTTTTGPTGAFEGTQYVYCETSFPVVPGDTFILDTRSYTDPTVTEVSFYVSRIGSDIGRLDVLFDDGTSATPLITLRGRDPSMAQGRTEWSFEAAALPQPLPTSYSFRFVYTVPPVVLSTFHGDLALDRFCIR